jgi:signal transduction histidine kinase
MDLSATSLAGWSVDLAKVRAAILRYGFSVACVAVALVAALGGQYYGFQDIGSPLFDVAIALVAWFAGLGPAVVAGVISAGCFTYFFSEPLYSFEVSSQDLPNFLMFVVWVAIITWFVVVRRRIEDDLRRARDALQVEVDARKRREDEIRRLNQELAARAAELEASNKELESFAYSVSHDLRAPLRHVAGYTELLQRRVSSLLDEKGRRYIQTIIESASRMGNLIDDLLSFSRIGRAETRRTLVNLGQLAVEVVAEIREEAKGREIAWKIATLPACYGDRAMLRLVIANLVSNAVKFTHARKQAEIEIGCDEPGPGEIEVFVRDNGAGFDMRYAHKLFGVFQRLHLAEDFEGTGIGLAIVQRIIHRHGGKVRAEGKVDRGATFYFSLPKA